MRTPGLAAALLVAAVAGAPGIVIAAGPAAAAPGATLDAGAAARVDGPFTLLESDATGVTVLYRAEEPGFTPLPGTGPVRFRVHLPGHATLTRSGAPALPARGVSIAIPGDARPSVTWEVLSRREWTGREPALAGGGATADLAAELPAVYPDPPVTFEETGRLRRHRVGRLTVRPIQYVRTAGTLLQVAEARIRIDFETPARAATAPAAAAASVPDAGSWEETYRALFLNADAARTFPREADTPDGGGASDDDLRPAAARSAGTAANGTPEFRILVGRTGLYRVSRAELAAAGWAADVPTSEIRLVEMRLNAANPAVPLTTPVPIDVDDTSGEPGIFDADDSFTFHGLDFRDRFHPVPADARYTRLHTYWLSAGPGGTRMPQVPGWFEASSAVTPESWIDTVRLEEDHVFAADLPQLLGRRLPDLDALYWTPSLSGGDSFPFSTPGREPSGLFRVRAEWQGADVSSHLLSLWIGRGCGAPDETRLLDRHEFAFTDTYVYDSGFTLPASLLADGCNSLRFAGSTSSPAGEREWLGAWFNHLEVSYPRRYTAVDGWLRFTSGSAAGVVEMQVSHLPRTDAVLYDVTNPQQPVRVNLEAARWDTLPPGPVTGYRLRFRAAVTNERTWILSMSEAIPPVGEAAASGDLPPGIAAPLTPVGPSTALDEPAGNDVLVVAPEAFQPALDPWLALRRSQGYTVQVVSPQEVWDLFSGGHKSPPAIRTWLRHLYRNTARPPGYLLLFGDAAETYDLLPGESDPDWVPTMVLYSPVEGQNNRKELAASDNWYVASLAAGSPEEDVYPDMHVGRLPVGSFAEAEAVVAKLVAWESGAGEAWRNRGLVVSDDMYSRTITGEAPYCWSGIERTFEEGGDSLVTILNAEACLTGFQVEHLKLADHLDPLPELGRSPGPGDCGSRLDRAIQVTASRVTPVWIDASSRGHLFQVYSGHANRNILATEILARFYGHFQNPADRNTEQLTNYGRPFVFIGVACHLNQFAAWNEAHFRDSFTESMLLLPGRGAVAAIGSSSFEHLLTNEPVEVHLTRSLFADHPRESGTGRARSILGEAFDLGLIRMVEEMGGGPDQPGFFRNTLQTYHLLGDPTMPVDMAPPVARLEANGVPVEPGGRVVSAAGGSTFQLAARLADDVQVASVSLRDDSVAVPAADIRVAAAADSAAGQCRGLDVAWSGLLRPETYELTLSAEDWRGSGREWTLSVVLEVSYRSGGIPVVDGQDVAPADFSVRVDSPVPLEPGEIDTWLNGEGGWFTWSAGDPEGRTWTGVPVRPLPEGPARVETHVRGRPARAAGATVSIRLASEASLSEVYFYPTPWDGNGPGRFTWFLNLPAGTEPRPVRLSVWSVSGRKVRVLTAEANPGRNTLVWDMRDSAGDVPANGVYLFRLQVDGTEDGLSVTDRLVIHR